MVASALVSGYWWVAPLIIVVVGFTLSRVFQPKSDIKRVELNSKLDWAGGSEDSLSTIYDYVLAFSENTIAWYQTHRRPKRYWGVSLRVGALLATASAGFVPLSNNLIGIDIPGAWSTALVAAAGIFVSIDGFAGHTSGWVRYMLAQQKVERLRDVFVLEWNALKLATTNAKDMLERATRFASAVGKVIDDETQEWATEFQNALKEMERARKTAADAERSGAIEISVKNPQAVQAWTLELDGNERGRTSGSSIAVTDVALGIRKVKAYGQDANGKMLSDEKVVKVEGGAMVAKELELR